MNGARPNPKSPSAHAAILQQARDETDDAECKGSAAHADSTRTAHGRHRRHRSGAGCGASGHTSGHLGSAAARRGCAAARRGRVGLLSSSLEGLEALRRGRVDREHHALLTVTGRWTGGQGGPRQAREGEWCSPSLLAVEPEWRGRVLDREAEGGEAGRVRRDGHEARVDAGAAVREGLERARAREGRLGDGVVLGHAVHIASDT